MRRLEKLLPQLRKFGVTSYRETDEKGMTFEVVLGPPADVAVPKKAAKVDGEEPEIEAPQEKYPKDAATLALKLVSKR